MAENFIEIIPSCTTQKTCSETTNEHTTTFPLECKICGVPARYSYFGVIACQTCKMFFRRNATLGQTALKCSFGGDCQININNRHVCGSCRLAKCFQSGMQMELFRSKVTSRTKNKRIESTSTELVKHHGSQILSTLHLLQPDTSSLTNTQWILLSNMVHSYDEHKLLLLSERMMRDDEHSLPVKLIDETLITEFFRLLYETTELCLRSNSDLCNVSFNDRSLFLPTAVECITCLGALFIFDQSHLINYQPFLNVLGAKYGLENLSRTMKLTQLIDPDVTFTKMALLLFAFSVNTWITFPKTLLHYTDPVAILHIQNTYADVTWRYLLYKYGHHQAVSRFIDLIQCLLILVQTMSQLQNVQSHVDDMDSIVEHTELNLVLDDDDQMCETTME